MSTKAPNPVDRYVGSRVRMRRIMLGMSQEKLGEALGLTFQQIQKYEKGTNRVGAGRLYLLAGFLGVPVQFFYDGLVSLPGGESGPEEPGTEPDEIFALESAFRSIADPETRDSLLALVRSVAETASPPKLRSIESRIAATHLQTSFAEDRRRIRK